MSVLRVRLGNYGERDEDVEMMAFEWMSHNKRSQLDGLYIGKSGFIGISGTTAKTQGIDSWEWCLLGYDKESNRVAIQKCGQDVPGALRCKCSNRHGYTTISAHGFLTNFNLMRYKGTRIRNFIHEKNMLIFPLPQKARIND